MGKQTPEHVAKRVAARRANGSYFHTAETRVKFSVVFKGRKHTENWKANASARMKANHPMKGRTHSLESRRKISLAHKGVVRPHMQGSNAPGWKGGKTEKVMALRRSMQYRQWRDEVYKRDDYTCQSCGCRGGRLNPDHVMPVSLYPELMFDALNGRTLCHPCHKATDTYGWKIKYFEPEMAYLIGMTLTQ